MQRVQDPTAVASRPAMPTLTGPAGFFFDGSPGTGVPATIVQDWWLNMMQEELCAILTAAGMPLDGTKTVLQALQALFPLKPAVAGTVRNGTMNISAVGNVAGFTADEVVVATALGGPSFMLSSFSQNINIGTVGAGGLDVASTSPVSGFLAIYAIYNPTTGQAALLATNATTTVAPTIYSGSAMPAGYTASALISVWPTGTGSQFVIGYQTDRQIWVTRANAFNTTTQSSVLNGFSIATAVPLNARTVSGDVAIQGATAITLLSLAANSTAGLGGVASAAGAITTSQISFNIPVLSRSLAYAATWTGGGVLLVFVSGYSI